MLTDSLNNLINNLVKKISQSWDLVLVAGSISVILSVTLFPYQFISRDPLTAITLLRRSLNPKSDLYDLISNILLFTALGFGLGGRLNRQLTKIGSILIISLVLCASVSLVIEILQVYLPTRTSSSIDLLTNILGGMLGTVAFFGWQFALRHWQIFGLSQNKLSFLTLGYVSLVCCLMISLNRTNNFSNWNPNFPLLIGNEQTGDRPWQGMISEVYFANHSLSKQEIARIFTQERARDPTDTWITAYQFAGKGKYRDRIGVSPALKWRQDSSVPEDRETISVSPQHWLVSIKPVSKLIRAMKQTSQFSLLTTVATRDTNQTGPARIISLSANPFQRNLTIGQQGSRLVVRLRTPISGAGESNTNLTFPGIFADTHQHQLLLLFDRHSLQLYVDRTEAVHTIKLTSPILFFHFLPAIGLRNFQVTPLNYGLLQLIFYSLVLSPPAIVVLVANWVERSPENIS